MSNRKYKIVYCTPSLYMAGGVERVLTLKANYFAEKYGSRNLKEKGTMLNVFLHGGTMNGRVLILSMFLDLVYGITI